MSYKMRCVIPASVLLVASCLPADASLCRRHFYNNSNYAWFVTMTPPNGCGNGSIVAHVCTVPPHSTLALHYNSIVPANGIVIHSKVYNGGFVVTFDCKIQHRGRTGNVSVNDPANGDVSTCGGNC